MAGGVGKGGGKGRAGKGGRLTTASPPPAILQLTAAPHTLCVHICRGHLGGMIGGAAVAWLLGPHMQRNDKGRFVDQPPVRWLAYPEGFTFSTGARPSTSGRPAALGQGAAEGAQGTKGPEDAVGGEGKGKRRGRRAHKPSKRSAEQAPPEEGPDQNPG